MNELNTVKYTQPIKLKQVVAHLKIPLIKQTKVWELIDHVSLMKRVMGMRSSHRNMLIFLSIKKMQNLKI